MQQRSRTDNGQPNTKRTERVNHRLPLQNQGQTSIQLYIFYLIFDYIDRGRKLDVAHRVMNFMCRNKLKPSDALIEEYRQSKTTKTLNQLPSYEELKKKIGMNEETYNILKKTYRSKTIKINNKI